MDKLTREMNAILESIDKNRWISFSKSESPIRFKAKDKLRAYKLIERHGKLSWQLTEEGYKAIELGGFHKWIKARQRKGAWQNTKIFLYKFWWTFVIPLIVGLILWMLTTNTESIPIEDNTQKDIKLESSIEGFNTKDSIPLRKSEYYLQSFSPVELFDGEIVITLVNTINYINQVIDLKLVSKNTGNSITIKGKQIGDVIVFENYNVSLLSLRRNISAYDLIIKIEAKKKEASKE